MVSNSTQISPYYASAVKRWFDVVLASLVFLVSLPILGIVSIFILLESGWPIFFCQARMGYGKRTFTIYKFRTMKPHSAQLKRKLQRFNQAPAPMFKMAADPRYTSIGKWLSRSGIDELPQLLNILLNEMSWVGPRPLPVEEAKALPASWDFRYAVKPGIISEWAINPQRYFSLEKWRDLERKTVENGSIKSDLHFLLRTLRYLSNSQN